LSSQFLPAEHLVAIDNVSRRDEVSFMVKEHWYLVLKGNTKTCGGRNEGKVSPDNPTWGRRTT
jgi:hypothetical protein